MFNRDNATVVLYSKMSDHLAVGKSMEFRAKEVKCDLGHTKKMFKVDRPTRTKICVYQNLNFDFFLNNTCSTRI